MRWPGGSRLLPCAEFGRGAVAAVLLFTTAGCVGSSGELHEPPSASPPPEGRLQDVLKGADQGPTVWSPAVTIPLAPALLVVDTTLKVANATAAWVEGMLSTHPEKLPVPESVQREAQMLERK